MLKLRFYNFIEDYVQFEQCGVSLCIHDLMDFRELGHIIFRISFLRDFSKRPELTRTFLVTIVIMDIMQICQTIAKFFTFAGQEQMNWAKWFIPTSGVLFVAIKPSLIKQR